MNIEVALVTWLSDRLHMPVFASVPENRPVSFVTVERTGGAAKNIAFDNPQVAIQCWAQTRHDASKLAYKVAEVMSDFAYEPHIYSVFRNSLYNFPDPDSGMGRYQILYQLTTRQ